MVVATAALENLGVAPDAFEWVIEQRSAVWASHLLLPHRCYDHFDPRPWAKWVGSRALCINLEQRYGLSAAFARAAVGRGGKVWGFATNRGATSYDHAVAYDPFEQHELVAFQKLFSDALSLPPRPVQMRARHVPAGVHAVVAVAGTGHVSRRWNASDWAHMVRRYAGDGRQVIVAAPADAALAQAVATEIGTDCEVLTGTWADVCRTVMTARRVFTVDGGMVHVASYYGVPVDAVFSAGRHRKWLPWSEGSRIIKRMDIDCQPCTVYGTVPPCAWRYRCKEMTQWRTIDGEAEFLARD